MNPYLKNQIETASQEQILIMLYDACIKYLNQAKSSLLSNDYETMSDKLLKAQNIIFEFQMTLDMEIGGDLAKNLYGLYGYYLKRLVEANMKKDGCAIDEVLEHIRGLRDTWKIAVEKTQREKGKNNLNNSFEC